MPSGDLSLSILGHPYTYEYSFLRRNLAESLKAVLTRQVPQIYLLNLNLDIYGFTLCSIYLLCVCGRDSHRE